MQHCMTVWAHRSQIFDRVQFIFRPNVSKLIKMVNVNKAFTYVPVGLRKVKAAN